jgi:hypothetical protein
MFVCPLLCRVSAACCSANFFGGPLAAHDIPTDVTVQAFLKPEGQTPAAAGAVAALKP